MADHVLERVPRELAVRDWALYVPLLETIPLCGLYNLEHLHDWIAEGVQQLWAVFDTSDGGVALAACVVTSVDDYPLRRVGRIRLCGGQNLAMWLPLIGEIEAAMRTAGCERVTVYGRRGWERALSGYGYTLQGIDLAKEL